ncbi:hypothetical protein EKL30_11035 [Candidimonas sp. SYP-B2681]|uniref:nuclear transport factor 2 family protein n=1 Tax=Candidimonas sp. SYP-B2681 TaxID=2497686 RepID=UPI000F895F8E|nr:nuclear transport factor 2 family protein [Candidimonas sp. SYP-B2681]RTZ43391.1 hypothetical protein EKL30_11035 [Candidimonas sp. SYP-B2681]
MNHDMKQCENQVTLFFRHLDERRYDALVALLASDAVWHRQGKVLEGPSAVHAALMQRSATMKIAHIITNLVFDEYETERCAMRGYMLVVRHEPGVEICKPSPLTGIESIRNMHIKMKRDAGHWLITELNGEDIIFALNA